MNSNPHEDRAREEKAKKLAREFVREMVRVAKEDIDGVEAMWGQLEKRCGVIAASEATRRRVVQLLEEIAI